MLKFEADEYTHRNYWEINDHRMTSMDWFDGANSAMRKFWDKKAFSLTKLLKETEDCLTRLTPGTNGRVNKERPRLEAMRRWCEREIAVRRAKAALAAAAKAAAPFMEKYEAEKIVSDQFSEFKRSQETA
ncbi:MAG: hypothetical protein EOP83_20880 [Verrucomicrobiaceae bacterium]|nr:MAG: hypothetical protein EOP83_20880 [Verrucomicrobiaceae bacterium]